MISLVVGGDGLIGGALKELLKPDVIATTRRQHANCSVFVDLMRPPDELPGVDVAYLCAGINGIRENEGNPNAWRANVDGVIAVINLLRGAHLIYISTGAVEWSDTSYARQRMMVECVLQQRGRCAIVRPEKVNRDSVASFASFLASLGRKQVCGVQHWPNL